MKIKLSQWAKNHNVCYKTAWMRAKSGELKIQRSATGQIFVLDDSVEEETLDDILHEFNRKIKNFLSK